MPPPPTPSRFPSDQEWITSLKGEHRSDTEEQRKASHDGAFHKYDVDPASLSFSGSFGTVVRAFLRTDNTQIVAVKVMQEKEDPRGTASKPLPTYEISALKALENHENICSLYDVFVTVSGILHIVMEYVDFGSLDRYLVSKSAFAAAVGPLSSEVFAGSILFQLCTAMKYIHSKGIIHRDIKPENILIASTNPPMLKVGDFGIAVREAMAIGACGTFLYMAPEVMEGKIYDHRADAYSVGAVFLEILLLAYHKSAISILNKWKRKVEGNRVNNFLGVLELAKLRAGLLNSCDDDLRKANHQALTLAKGLLYAEPNRRLAMDVALRNPWPREMNAMHSPANSGNIVDRETNRPIDSGSNPTRPVSPKRPSSPRQSAAQKSRKLKLATQEPAQEARVMTVKQKIEGKRKIDVVVEPTVLVQRRTARFIEIGPKRRRLA